MSDLFDEIDAEQRADEEVERAARAADERIKRKRQEKQKAAQQTALTEKQWLKEVPPEKASGCYRVHIVHEALDVQFDMLLRACADSVIYHGATFRVGANKVASGASRK